MKQALYASADRETPLEAIENGCGLSLLTFVSVATYVRVCRQTAARVS